MSARVVPMDGDGHHAVLSLLPWYVTGRLDHDEVAAIEAHLAGCEACQAELPWERQMAAAQAALGAVGVEDAERGLARLRARIQAADYAQPTTSPTPPPRPEASRAWGPWWRWVLGAQFTTIVLLAMLLVAPNKPSEQPYRALGAPAPSGRANLLVRFRPDAAEREIRRAPQDAGAWLEDGPTVTDAYLLRVPAERQAAALAGLRATPIVVLAESLDTRARP